MKFKRTNKVFYILSITLFVTTIVLIVFLIRTKRENLPYNEEYKVEIESPQFYIDDILRPDYNSLTALDDLFYIDLYQKNLAVLYEMFMADYHHEPEAASMLYEAVEQLYDSVGSPIPKHTFDYVFALLKEGADSSNYDNCDVREFGHHVCCRILSKIYEEGKYVERDSALVNYYKSLALQK